MTDEFKTVTSISEGYYTEKRSKFLAIAHHVETVDEVKQLLAGYRKKYYDARHVCYAYMLGAGREEFRANDDGEPSSTAGKPILGQINSNELTDIRAPADSSSPIVRLQPMPLPMPLSRCARSRRSSPTPLPIPRRTTSCE